MSAILSAKGDGISGQGVATLARRRFQTGTVFLRGKKGNQVWVGRWREDVLQPDCTLRRILRSEVLGTLEAIPTKRLALRELQTRLDEVNSPVYTAVHNSTLGEFIEKWEDAVLPNLKPSTQKSMKGHLDNHIEGGLGKISLRELSPELLQLWVRGIKGSPKTVRNVVSTLRAILRTAVQWNYLRKTPADGLVLPINEPVEARAYSKEEMLAIVKEAKHPWNLFFWLAAETGMRAGELCALQWNDISFERCSIAVRRSVWRGKIGVPKTASGVRYFAISQALAKQLKAIACTDGSLVFHRKNGKPLDPDGIVARKLRPILDRLGLPRGGMHAFRHGNATLMDDFGTPVKVRQERLGHSTPVVTLGTYTHVPDASDIQAAEKFGQLFDPNFVPNCHNEVA